MQRLIYKTFLKGHYFPNSHSPGSGRWRHHQLSTKPHVPAAQVVEVGNLDFCELMLR